jgi:dolichyl-phosphate beta-glucosyltransferase
METLSIVIPAYNEEERLPLLLRTLADSAERDVEDAGLRLLEVLIVDDGSSDRTRGLLREAEGSVPAVRPVLGSGGHRGKGHAVAEGVRRAKGDSVLLADADLSTPLSELRKLTRARKGAALVIGSRGLDTASVDRGPLHRKLLGRGFNRVVRAITGLRVHDTQCGFKLLSAELARDLLAAQQCEGFAFDVELLVKAERWGVPIVEVPVLYVHDAHSRLQVVPATVAMLRDVVAVSYRARSPLAQERQPDGSSGRRGRSGAGKTRTPPVR